MSEYQTEQEAFWASSFGDEYIERNKSNAILVSDIGLFSKVLSCRKGINSVIEFGANIGLNTKAIRLLLPDAEISAIEINAKAAKELEKQNIKVYNQSILDFVPDYKRDFVLIKTVLIHIKPEELPKVYDLLYQSSSRYICIAEYYNPTPVEVLYLGHKERLFKRDFPGEMMDKYPDLKLVDYGFAYHRDYQFPQDDVNWFLLEKVG